jgi:folate-binding protein YgfZ
MPTTPQNDVTLSAESPASFSRTAISGKVTDEFQALTSTCAAYDLASRAKIRLTGGDRTRWLNGMVTNNVRDLAVGQGVYAFLLNPQGHILGDLYAYNLGEEVLVDTDSSQLDKILATFDHYIIMDDVEVANLGDQILSVGIAGPETKRTLAAAGFTIADLKPLQIADIEWRGQKTRVVCGEHEPYPSFEIWTSPDTAREALDALAQSGAKLASNETLDLYRIALGVPRYGQDIRERDLPQETDQNRALNFSKGCYVGQEIVERIRSRGNVHRKFTGFRIDGPPPAHGTKIQLQDKDVGEVTTSALIPASTGALTFALGYIRREAGTPGKDVRIGESSARVSELPFADLLASS